MKAFFLVLLSASLAANAGLLLRRAPGGAAVALTPAPVAPVPAPESADRAAVAWRALAGAERSEPGELVRALRAAGADESAVCAVLDGVLRWQHREAVTSWRIERLRTAWWQGSARGAGGAPSVRTLVDEPLRELLGVDPLDVADAEARYDFLPPEKRRLLALIDLDYAGLQAHPVNLASSRATTRVEFDEAQLLAQERRKDVLAALTPGELAEYELRFSRTAAVNADRFATMGATEQKYRAIKPLLDAHQEEIRTAVAQSGHGPLTDAVAQRTIDRIVAAVGYERALGYLWGVPGSYDRVAGLMRETGRPASDAAQVFQLAAETGAGAAALHRDGALGPEQKLMALRTLQQETRAHLDALVPPAAQAQLPAPVRAWFAAMDDGRYAPVRPTLSGTGMYIASPVSVTSPVEEAPRIAPIARPQ